MKARAGLRYIIYYDRLIGNTYFGWNFGEKTPKIKKYFFIAWNLLFLLMVSFNCYLGMRKLFYLTDKQNEHNTLVAELRKTSSCLPIILFSVGLFSYTIQSLIIGLFLLIRGQKILDVINEIEIIKANSKVERKTGLSLVVAKIIIFSFIISILVFFNLNYYKPNDIQGKLYFSLIFTCYFLTMNTHCNILVLLFYKSILISKQIKTYLKANELSLVFDILSRLHLLVKRLDSLIGLYNLFVLLINTIICISSLCMLAIAPGANPANNLWQMLSSFIMISMHCLVYDMIPKRMSQFLSDLKDRFKELNENKSISEQQLNHIIIMRLNEMKDEMCFTAFNLFKLNANTLLSCIALIISYSIVIIQTNGQSTGSSPEPSLYL